MVKLVASSAPVHTRTGTHVAQYSAVLQRGALLSDPIVTAYSLHSRHKHLSTYLNIISQHLSKYQDSIATLCTTHQMHPPSLYWWHSRKAICAKGQQASSTSPKPYSSRMPHIKVTPIIRAGRSTSFSSSSCVTCTASAVGPTGLVFLAILCDCRPSLS